MSSSAVRSLCLFVLLQGITAYSEDNNASSHDETSRVARKALIQGTYKSGETISKTMYFEPGKRVKVEWDAKPAVGNCVVSLFSIFNADLLFDYGTPEDQRPPWSEIAFETFGGAVGRDDSKQFQSQYISQNDPNAPPTQRGTQHVYSHYTTQPNIVDIYDGNFHKFEIEWLPYQAGTDSEIVYRLDGNVIRTVTGGDANLLEAPLDIYAGVWATSGDNGWGCTPEFPNSNRRGRQLQTTFSPIRINCGGGAVGDYTADAYAMGGSTYASGGCGDASCSERYGEVEYKIPVPNGNYVVKLEFTEVYYSTAGSRVFDVYVEDDRAAQNLDIVAEGNNVEVLALATVQDGFISIRLASVIENPKISSIVITEGDELPVASFDSPVKINCGGGAVAGFSRDMYSTGGSTYSTGGCTDPSCSERWGELAYEVPVPNGEYMVTLGFTEIYYATAGSRVFNVLVEDTVAASNLDPVAQGNDVEVTIETTVTDGFVSIQLTKVIENPKISYIVIEGAVDGGGGGSPTPPVPTPTLAPVPTSPTTPTDTTSIPTTAPTPDSTTPLTYAPRPRSAEVSVRTVKVFEQQNNGGGSLWIPRKDYEFRNSNDLYNEWNLSNWGFDGFDGAFDPSAAVVADNQLFLELVEN